MSAYIVENDHIDALLSYAIKHNVRYSPEPSAPSVEITAFNATEIGRILLDENERSVRHRYPGDEDSTADSASYNFRRFAPLPEAMIILKACDGFDYQACETDNYEQSVAAIIVNAIRGSAIPRLPGYSDAPGWHLSRPVKA
jgi:hypothetical protein